jgi:squalene-hopene/tetraprenyl-beta-curcumene cyclase
MHSPTLRLFAEDHAPLPPPIVTFQVVRSRAQADPLRSAISRARQALLGRMLPDGSLAESQVVDPRSLAMLVLAKAYLEPHEPGQYRQEVRGLLTAQRSDGGWSKTHGNLFDLSVSVLAYLALKLDGQSPASEPMVCARRAILERGGVTGIDVPAQLCLALLGQYPYDAIDAPKLARFLLPGLGRAGFRFEDSPTELAILCQAVVAALQPRRYVASDCGIRELFLTQPRAVRKPGAVLGRWCRSCHFLPWRRRTLATARRFLLAGIHRLSAGVNHDVETMAWTAITLDVLGFTEDTAPRQQLQRRLEETIDCEPETPRLRAPGYETVAETAGALLASGLTSAHPGVSPTIQWLARHQSRKAAEMARLLMVAAQCRKTPPTADILPPPLTALTSDQYDEAEQSSDVPPNEVLMNASRTNELLLKEELFRRQRPNGTWSDGPGSDDIVTTAAALKSLIGMDLATPRDALARAAPWLRSKQRPDGSWPAAENAGAIRVTAQVLQALIALADDPADEAVAAAAAWLVSHQQPDGGWGDAAFGSGGMAGEGTSTASDTADALLGLMAAGQGRSEAVSRGVDFLLAQQSADGQWNHHPAAAHRGDEDRSPLAQTVVPLLALARYAVEYSEPRRWPVTVSPQKAPLLRLVPWSCEAG